MPPPPHSPLSLTLIVATTLNMGIGRAGSLPWPSLKSEMAYFARVTARPPPNGVDGTVNAVVMGRKTWESIPPKFRPLKNRINVVVSGRGRGEVVGGAGGRGQGDDDDHVVVVDSLEEGLLGVARRYSARGKVMGRVFVIGGAGIYDAALRLDENLDDGRAGMKPRVERILWTKIMTEFECDTFFPVDLKRLEKGEEGWVRRSTQELESWTGEDGLDGVREEAGVRFEFCMLERR